MPPSPLASASARMAPASSAPSSTTGIPSDRPTVITVTPTATATTAAIRSTIMRPQTITPTNLHSRTKTMQEMTTGGLRTAVRTVKKFGRTCAGQELFYFREVRQKHELFGNDGAAFAVLPELLSQDSVVYSFGIGTDLSFDLSLIQNFGL